MARSERRPAVVFIPGFMQPGTAWAPVADLLPERYPSVLLEHAEHTFEGRLREISTAGEGAVLAGYSLGGRLALHAALRDSGRYAGLVTVGASAGIEAPGARAERAAADARLAGWMETQPIEQIVAIWERQPLFADQSDALVEGQRAGRLSQDPRGLATLLRTAGQGAVEPVWQQLHTLDLPLLAVAGSVDERYAQAARRMARAAPRGRAAIVEGAGHAAHLQRPGAVADLLAEFLDEHLGERSV
ncbi:MAG: alpha/beta fold hydrolase [Actinomycetota bacterium]|nr:alpha/beta fold hydrolase [Actinomycetota bacterium]